MFEVTNQPGRRTITVKLSGTVSCEDMTAFVDAYRRATDIHEGAPHVVWMDVRGLQPLEPPARVLLEGALRYARQHGGVLRPHAQHLVPVASAA